MSAQNEPRIRALIERINELGAKPRYVRVDAEVAQTLVDLGLVQWSDDFSELVLR